MNDQCDDCIYKIDGPIGCFNTEAAYSIMRPDGKCCMHATEEEKALTLDDLIRFFLKTSDRIIYPEN